MNTSCAFALLLAVLCLALCTGCGSLPVTQAAFDQSMTTLNSKVDARVAAGEAPEVAVAAEMDAWKKNELPTLVSGAVEEKVGGTPISEKMGLLAMAALWIARNIRYAKAGGLPGLLLGGLLPSMAKPGKTPTVGGD